MSVVHEQVPRSGFVAVAGRPNAGKSTLVNTIVGEHVTIVSPIAQTTRRTVRAALTRDGLQVIFVDLPGSQSPVDSLTRRMQSAVQRSLEDVDAVLWVVDASVEPRDGERAVADQVFAAGLPVVIAANKIDRMTRPAIVERLAKLDELTAGRSYEALVPVSARAGTGVDVLVEEVARLLPPGPELFPGGEVTDMRTSERISEYVREATLAHLRDELPHATVVEVAELEEADGHLRCECVIWVERDSQVGIVVGAGGATIRSIGTSARATIERALGVQADLFVKVKVRRRWRNDDTWLERAGL